MICEFLPSTFGVGVGLTVLHGQSGIQQKHTLLSPFSEISVGGRLEADFLVGKQVLIDVFQRRRGRDWLENAEAKSMCLVGLMIGILSDDDDLDVVDGGDLERVENVLLLGVNLHGE